MVRGTKGKHRSALLAVALSKALDIPCWLPTFSGTRTWIECKRHWFIPLFTDELWQEVGLSDLVSTAERLMKGPLPPSYPPAKQEADKNQPVDEEVEVEMVKASEEEPEAEVKVKEEAAEVPEAKDGPSPAPSCRRTCRRQLKGRTRRRRARRRSRHHQWHQRRTRTRRRTDPGSRSPDRLGQPRPKSTANSPDVRTHPRRSLYNGAVIRRLDLIEDK